MRKLKKIGLGLVVFMLVMGVAFLIYVSDYYEAEENAVNAYDQADKVIEGQYTLFEPDQPSDTVIVFYPGGKVEAIAYTPLLNQLVEKGITCVLVEMPFNLAVFDAGAAESAWSLVEDMDHQYIMGHSLGGAMASSYASDHPDTVDGLILLGAYLYGEYPPEKSLTVYGSFNDNLEENIDYTENIVIIDGGNHAQFGNYGKQKGDPDATISPAEQQATAVDAIMSFMVSEI